MSHNTEGRGRANSTAAANGQFKTAMNTDGAGSMAPPAVEEPNPQVSVDMQLETAEDYAMGSTNRSSSNSSPPRRESRPVTASSRRIGTGGKAKGKESLPLLEPPVTKTTLSELDVNKIVHNPKLRHDINFDPDLHFRPNLDGEKGRRKAQKADNFWEIMRTQLRQYLINREQFEKELGDEEWCLPATLKAIRGILETLVPQRDRSEVEETFNVDLLKQQFRKGVADLPKLAAWLSRLLKCHCAPMRDTWVDGMVAEISKGDQEGDVPLLVLGMRNLLGVLEAMKLDVANHQIRCLRPLLIEDTVHFEQKFFMKKIALGKVGIASAHLWFRRASSIPDVGPLTLSPGNFWDFMKALVNLTLPSKSDEVVPHTFLFDEERLIKLRSDMEDLINLEVCMHMFRNLEANSSAREVRSVPRDDTPAISASMSPFSRPTSAAEGPIAQLPLPHHFSLKSRYLSSASPSPQSSPATTASTPDTYPPTPLYLSLPYVDSASQLRAALLAILASANVSDKWASFAGSLALQVLRSTTSPLSALPEFEYDLKNHISDPQSTVYQGAEQRVLSQLFPVLQKLVDSYTPLTNLQIFESATTPKIAPGHVVSGAKEEIDEIATRLAHVGVLHWRVWAPLAYLVDPDEQQETSPIERARSMP